MLLTVPDLRQDSTEACSRGVGLQAECLAKVREGRDRTHGQQCLELVKGGLAVLAPMKDRVFPGQGMLRCSDGCETLYIAPVVVGQAQERADFGGCFRGRDLPNGSQERGVWQEAFLGHPVA